MDEAALIVAIRHAAHIATTHPTYTDGRLRLEATDVLRTVFGEPILSAREGYWVKRETQAITTSIGAAYRIPHRAMVNGLKAVEVADSDGRYYPLRPGKESEIGRLTDTGEPNYYDIESDYVVLYPPPVNNNFTLRLTYYLRHPQLVEGQTIGQITSINENEFAINGVPKVRGTAVDIAGDDYADIIKPNGGHDLVVISAQIDDVETSPDVIDFVIGPDFSRVAVGDFIRAASETDWPMLPQDFHRTVADATAVVILTDMGATQKASALGQKVSADIDRLRKMIQPRNKHADKVLRPKHRAFRNRGGRRFPMAPSS